MSMLFLTLLFTWIAFSGLPSTENAIQTAAYGSSSPGSLVQSLSGTPSQMSPIFAQSLTLFPLSEPSRNRIRRDRRLRKKEGSKNQHLHAAAWNSVHWLPRYSSTVIYRCIAPLQLLHRWQHQSRKSCIHLEYAYPLNLNGTL
jgi:hypothetical protein